MVLVIIGPAIILDKINHTAVISAIYETQPIFSVPHFCTDLNLVSFVGSNSIYVRTFEKGVERETLSCGTGAVASVIASSIYKNISINKVITRGGKLNVLFNRVNNYKFTDIYLIGNPKEVFKGEITL